MSSTSNFEGNVWTTPSKLTKDSGGPSVKQGPRTPLAPRQGKSALSTSPAAANAKPKVVAVPTKFYSAISDTQLPCDYELSWAFPSPVTIDAFPVCETEENFGILQDSAGPLFEMRQYAYLALRPPHGW